MSIRTKNLVHKIFTDSAEASLFFEEQTTYGKDYQFIYQLETDLSKVYYIDETLGNAIILNSGGGGGSSALFPNGVKVITESRTLQADDAGYVLMLESPDSATQVVLTIPTPSPLNVGDNFGIIVSDGNDNANNGWIDEEGSPIRPFRGAITLFTTTSLEGNNVTITVNSPLVEDGVNNSTVTRYLYDNVIVLGDRVDVLENRDFITKTKYEIDGLISTNALVKGATYKITGVHPTLYNDGTNSGTTILLKAISENVLETQGTGIFYNPKYNQAVAGFGIWDNKMYGTFSTIVGNFDYENKETVTADNGATGILLADGMIQYVSGNWSSATSITGDTSSATANVAGFVTPTYSIGDKVIWGGYSWTNVNGNIGASTDVLNLNAEWSKNVYDTTNYNIAYDLIEYDYANNWISRRYEVKSNVDVRITHSNYSLLAGNYSLIYSAISVQQFGNPYNSSTNKGILNKYIDNACDESINFSGSKQQNLTFGQNSFQQYITFGQNSYQSNLTFGQDSYQRNLTFGQHSHQHNLTFGQNSYQSNLILGQGVQQRYITFGQSSGQQNLTFAQNSFQQYITFGQDSKQQNLTFAQNSFQQCITFGQYSQVDFNNQILYSMVFSDFKTKNFTVPDLSSATYIFNGNIKEVYQRPDGTIKLKFMNNSDVLEVHGIDD